jgi:hypothetical protein
MRRMSRNALSAVLAAAAIAALAAGCSNTVEEPTATVTQYASALNGPIKDFDKAFNDYSGRCPLYPSRLVCPVNLHDMQITTSTIVITIQGLQRKSSHSYIGQPPVEISQLTNDTYSFAQNLAADLADLKHPAAGWLGDAVALDSTLKGWGPYLI